MCGITGFIDACRRVASCEYLPIVAAMGETLHHRGPDDGGSWLDTDLGIALGHRRLSVIDLSTAGHQPMTSACGRFVISYNGEIYNFQELRRELDSLQATPEGGWRGLSDTEVLLAAIRTWGVANALERLNGMFAFALWDRELRCLHLARDRMGEKPLYYGFNNRIFLFGSELKALRACRYSRFELNRDAVALLLRHNYIPAPFSIYRGIFKLPPACHLVLSWSELAAEVIPDPVRYWNLHEIAAAGQQSPLVCPESEAVDIVDNLLANAVRQRMLADVPLGAFLSGGIDSSLVVALMQRHSRHRVKTFALGFREGGYDEALYARRVATHLGTDHTEHYVSAEEALAVIPELPDFYDEPFADSSQIPTLIISKLARQQVTVSLSGDGGDELFSGYERYRVAELLWKKLAWLPAMTRRGGAVMAETMADVSTFWPGKGSALFRSRRKRTVADRLDRLAGCMGAVSREDLYRRLVSLWQNPGEIVIGAREPGTLLTAGMDWLKVDNYRQMQMYFDQNGYLPDDILVKVDRASMGYGLEVRVPFLDHRLVECSWRIPGEMHVHEGQGKRLLRQLLKRYVPDALIERPKMGFGIPLDDWLRGPLRDWAETLLAPAQLQQQGIFEPAPIRRCWQEHCKGTRNHHYRLWPVLMFQAWWEQQ